MGVVMRPRFGRPCYDGCGETVPTQRLNQLASAAAERGESLLLSERICVGCEARRARETSVTRKPRG